MKIFLSILVSLASSAAFADSINCKAQLLVGESEQIAAKDVVTKELEDGNAHLVRQVMTRDRSLTYTYNVLVQEGKIQGLGISQGSDARSSSYTKYFMGQDSVLMNSSIDGSTLIVNCNIQE